MCCNISLRCKVLTIAIGCICFYIASTSLQVWIISSKSIEKMLSKNQDIVFYNDIDYKVFLKIIIFVIVLCFCGLLTCIIFILGVIKQRKVLILPFMIFSETLLTFLIIMELVCDIYWPLYGLILLFFIPPIVYTVVTTRAFYHEVGKTRRSSDNDANENPEKTRDNRVNKILNRY